MPEVSRADWPESPPEGQVPKERSPNRGSENGSTSAESTQNTEWNSEINSKRVLFANQAQKEDLLLKKIIELVKKADETARPAHNVHKIIRSSLQEASELVAVLMEDRKKGREIRGKLAKQQNDYLRKLKEKVSKEKSLEPPIRKSPASGKEKREASKSPDATPRKRLSGEVLLQTTSEKEWQVA